DEAEAEAVAARIREALDPPDG
ncbi:MAG: hypothetical protein JWL73_870, partial [Actinomycetia bacterium]|nr:hypothetical protein [Actinomycetes bacterium]